MVWLSDLFVPFAARPGHEVVLPENMLGLPPVTSWPAQGGSIPWVLDPAEHPRPENSTMNRGSAGLGNRTGAGKSRKRKRRDHKHCELKVTQKGIGEDEPQFFPGSGSSSLDVSDTMAVDSGVNLAPFPLDWAKRRPRLPVIQFRRLGLQLPAHPLLVLILDSDWMWRPRVGMNSNWMMTAC